jgi:hypothetical protein
LAALLVVDFFADFTDEAYFYAATADYFPLEDVLGVFLVLAAAFLGEMT